MRVAAMLLVLLLVGCGGTGPASPSAPGELQGSWQLAMGSMDGQRLRTLPDNPVTLTIEGADIGGISACNSYGGRLTLVGGRLEILDLGMTAMGCAEEVMAVETGFMAALDRVSGISRDDEELVLNGAGVELRFHALPEPPTAELVDSTWVLETLVVGDVASAAMGERATLEIRSDGTLGGSTGCRGFEGAWIERGEQILAHTLAMTDQVCPDALSDQDSHVVSVIGDGFVPAIDGDRMTLSDPGGAGLVYRADR